MKTSFVVIRDAANRVMSYSGPFAPSVATSRAAASNRAAARTGTNTNAIVVRDEATIESMPRVDALR